MITQYIALVLRRDFIKKNHINIKRYLSYILNNRNYSHIVNYIILSKNLKN
jgi:hypothetical protein